MDKESLKKLSEDVTLQLMSIFVDIWNEAVEKSAEKLDAACGITGDDIRELNIRLIDDQK